MLSFRTGSLQYQLSPPKAQIPAYFQKVLDTHSFVDIITQQLSNSATQQLSNSATQQLSNSATQQLSNSASRLCPEKRAIFFSQTSFFFLISDVSEYIRKRNRLRIYLWHRPHNRYRLWNTFFKSFLAYSRKEEEYYDFR